MSVKRQYVDVNELWRNMRAALSTKQSNRPPFSLKTGLVDAEFVNFIPQTQAEIDTIPNNSIFVDGRDGEGYAIKHKDNTGLVQALGSSGGGDHGLLSGLLDDDHPQYLTTIRSDARHFLKNEFKDESLGVGDAGAPIKLASTGKISPTMLPADSDQDGIIMVAGEDLTGQEGKLLMVDDSDEEKVKVYQTEVVGQNDIQWEWRWNVSSFFSGGFPYTPGSETKLTLIPQYFNGPFAGFTATTPNIELTETSYATPADLAANIQTLIREATSFPPTIVITSSNRWMDVTVKSWSMEELLISIELTEGSYSYDEFINEFYKQAEIAIRATGKDPQEFVNYLTWDTGKFRFTSGGPGFSLWMNSGEHAANSTWSTLGFDNSQDYINVGYVEATTVVDEDNNTISVTADGNELVFSTEWPGRPSGSMVPSEFKLSSKYGETEGGNLGFEIDLGTLSFPYDPMHQLTGASPENSIYLEFIGPNWWSTNIWLQQQYIDAASLATDIGNQLQMSTGIPWSGTVVNNKIQVTFDPAGVYDATFLECEYISIYGKSMNWDGVDFIGSWGWMNDPSQVPYISFGGTPLTGWVDLVGTWGLPSQKNIVSISNTVFEDIYGARKMPIGKLLVGGALGEDIRVDEGIFQYFKTSEDIELGNAITGDSNGFVKNMKTVDQFGPLGFITRVGTAVKSALANTEVLVKMTDSYGVIKN